MLAGTEDKYEGGKIHSVASYIVHEGYNHHTIDYDFALLKLETELSFSERIQPVQLVKADDEPMAVGTVVLVSGWGKLKASHTSGSRYLQAVELPTFDQNKCKRRYSGINTVTDRMFCAGYMKGGKNGW